MSFFDTFFRQAVANAAAGQPQAAAPAQPGGLPGLLSALANQVSRPKAAAAAAAPSGLTGVLSQLAARLAPAAPTPQPGASATALRDYLAQRVKSQF